MSYPEMIPVSSSNIESIGYFVQNQEVYVRFLNGGVYVYRGVPEHEFQNLLSAPSLGSYLHRNYKNVYPYERIE
ncbi:KTSC domain-containing protein [Leeuwenhoekiella sp. A16]|uniref:KTSC domain-containing protein n=1 Tax=unclassified Leeuwenhoekiella TaxID=2615029 RepID=UPI003A812991